MPYRLAELHATSFRGFADLSVDLGQALVVLGGPNGSGKSSAINAVAWALAGKAIAQKKLGVVEIPERKAWQVIHEGDKECHVRLMLLDGGRQLVVARSSVKDRCEVKGGARADDPLGSLGLTIDSLLSSVFLPQELLRIPIALDPQERGRIFLDLVGLGSMSELEGTLQDCAKWAKGRVEAIAALRESIDDQIASQVSLKKRDIDEQREKARKAGYGADLDTPEAVPRLVVRTRQALAALCERHGAAPSDLPDVASPEGLVAFEKGVREGLSRIETASADVGRRAELERRRLAIAALATEARTLDAARRDLATQKEELAKRGSEASVKTQKASLEKDLERLREEIGTASAQGEVIDRALAYFERLMPGPEPIACPVCETRPIDLAHVREHLRRSLERAGVQPLRERRAEAERALAEVQAWFERCLRRQAAEHEHAKRVEDLRRRVGELRGQPVSASEDVERVLQAMLDAAQKELADVLRRIEERGKDAQKVRDELEAIGVLRRIQEDRLALARLDELPREASYAGLREQEHRAQVLLCVAEGLRGALKEEKRRAFDAAFEAVQGDVVRWFRRITDRPDCASLRIDSEKWSLMEETGQGEREVTATFNVGDLTSVALAVFLATATRASHGAGFLLLDDPTQGLDDAHKRRLAEVLGEIAGSRQVVVASADEEFLRVLATVGTAGRLVYRLRERAGGRPCEVESTQ